MKKSKTPAYAPLAEDSVISQIHLKGAEGLREAEAAGITADSFYTPAHKTIFRTMEELADEGVGITDPVTLATRLEKNGLLPAVGGWAGLMDKLTFRTTYATLGHELRELKDTELKRELQLRIGALHAHSGDCPTPELTARLQDLAELASSAPRHREWSPREGIRQACLEFQADFQAGTHITGLRSGYFRLDALTGGFKNGTFCVIGARPAMGKTTFGLNLVRSFTLHPQQGAQPAPTLFLSGEMTAPALWHRLISMEAQVDTNHAVRTRDLAANVAFLSTARKWEAAPLTIREVAGMKIDPLLRIIRRAHAKGAASIVVLDYLQLIKGNSPLAEKSTVDSVAEVCQKLHTTATALGIPIIALAQVNRDTDGQSPKAANLKGSGDIEQAADLVLLLDRPEVYADPASPADYLQAVRNLAILQVSKNRSGPCGHVCLHFTPACHLFTDRQDQSIPTPKRNSR